MATVDVQWDQFVFRMKAYKYIRTVANFQFDTAYRFSTAEGRPSLWSDSAPPPPPPPLFRVNYSGIGDVKWLVEMTQGCFIFLHFGFFLHF